MVFFICYFLLALYVTYNHIKLTQLFDTTNTIYDYTLIYRDI